MNTPLTDQELIQANDTINQAGYTLGREILPQHLPALQRKYHVAVKADTIFAFGVLELNRTEVRGSQGWTVQMALQMGKKVFVFDYMTHTWFHADTFYAVDPATNGLKVINRFRPSGQLPTLDASSAVVGPRIVGRKTKEELRKLFDRTFCQPENIENVRKQRDNLHL